MGEPPPPLKLPEPVVFVKERQPDEEIPAFGRITRVNIGDINMLLSKFLSRLIEAFPDINAQSWSSYLAAMTHDQTAFFRKTEEAVICAVSLRMPFENAIYVRLAFLFHRNADNEALALMRELRDWARPLGAKEILGLNRHCDLTPAVLTNRLRHVERREELVFPL